VLGKVKYCPVCGGAVVHAAVPDSVDKPKEKQRDNMFFYSSICLIASGLIQYMFFNPLLNSDFSSWANNAYMRGLPWFVCVSLPLTKFICDLLVVIVGLLGIGLARRRNAVNFYKVSGIIMAFVSSGALVMRIIYEHVIHRSYSETGLERMLPEAITQLREQHSRSLYPMFIIAAVTLILSFFYIYGSTRFKKTQRYRSSRVMIIVGIPACLGSLFGVFFGRNEGELVPFVATWATITLAGMVAVGFAGLSWRRHPFTREIWGYAYLSFFTFFMLQTIYYAYSAMLQKSLFYYGSFIWIAVLACILAVSTVMTAFYMSGTALKGKSAASVQVVSEKH